MSKSRADSGLVKMSNEGRLRFVRELLFFTLGGLPEQGLQFIGVLAVVPFCLKQLHTLKGSRSLHITPQPFLQGCLFSLEQLPC